MYAKLNFLKGLNSEKRETKITLIVKMITPLFSKGFI